MKALKQRLISSILCIILIISAAGFSGCKSSISERREDESSTLYVGCIASSFPVSFMPWLSREGIAPTISSMLYNTLFSFDEKSGEYQSLLGKDWCYTDYSGNEFRTGEGKIDYAAVEEYYSDPDSLDYMVVKVTLFDNITWSDGQPLTVDDVYYTFDIATDNALSNHAGALAWTADLKHKSDNGNLQQQGIFTYNKNDVWNPYPIAESEKDTVFYLRVNKVLGAVSTLFTSILILPEHIWAPIVSKENQLNSSNPEGELLKQYENPIGCGAWTLDKSQSGRQMIVLHNRGNDYHLKSADGSPLYKVDTIKLMLYLDENTAMYALLKGYVDMLDKAMNSNYLRLFEKEEDIFVSNVDGIFVQTLVMNVNPQDKYLTSARETLKNPKIREAIALAVNQDEIVSRVLNGAGSTVSAGLMMENQTELYNPDSNILSGDYETRIAEANEILDGIYPEKDNSGYRLYDDGKRLSYEVLAGPGEMELLSFLQIQMQKIGIEIKYKAKGSMPEDTYLFDGDFDMAFQNTVFNISDVDVMYQSHFVSLNRTSNYGRLADQNLADKIDQMRTTLNHDKKIELIKEIQMLIAGEYYKIPVYSANIISVARTDRFKGYTADAGQTVFNDDTLKNLVRAVGE